MKAGPGVADHPARILIVDDERRNRQLLEVMLAPEGYLLQTAGGGEEALAVVARQPPDLILLDIMMPGMDGYEVARRIKGDPATKNIPVIMITALDDRNARMLGLGAGAEDFLTKPVDRAELCVRVRNLLRLKTYGDYFDTLSRRLEGDVAARTADLIELSERLSLATAVAKIGVWEWELKGNTLTWDATMFGLYGLEPAVPMPRARWAAAVHPEDLPAVEATWQRTLDEKSEGVAEFRIIVADGTVRNVSSVARATLDQGSGGRRLIGVDMDITERKVVVDALLQSEANYRRLFESANDAIMVLAPGTELILDANPRACEIYGMERSELIGTSLKARFCDAAGGEIRIPLLVDPGSDRDSETLLRRRDGDLVHLEVSSSPVEYAGRTAVLSISRDVTERKLAQARLARLAAAVDQAAESIIVTDEEGTIQYVNPAFERITGYPTGEVIGRNASLLQSGCHDRAFYASFWRTLKSGETWHGRFINRHKDGHLFHEDATISPVLGSHKEIVNFVSVSRDVTHELALEAQLRQSQKMEAVGKLAAGVAHDFNNLLQALLSQLQALRARAGADERLQHSVAECEAVVRRGAVLTRQLLLFSRHETMKTERIELNELLQHDAVLLRSLLRENVALDMELDGAQLWVEGDRGQLDQVVMNLAVNASDAMPDGGRVVLRSGRDAVGAVWFFVQDSGTGIPPKVKERIFEPFFTTKSAGKGTGLGLSVVHGIVTHHGGYIAVDSEPGAGTTFRIVLPAAIAAEVPAVAVESPSAPLGGGRGESVLVVEDEEGARNGLQELLSLMGYEVVAAGSGEEAGVLPDSPAFDLLLTDLVLPGIGGGDVAANAAARWPGIKVILMSGYTEDEALKTQIGTGAVLFLQKPFGADELARKVRGALDESRPAHGDETAGGVPHVLST